MGLLQLYVYIVEYYIRIHTLNCRRNDANSATIHIYKTRINIIFLLAIVCDLATRGGFDKT